LVKQYVTHDIACLVDPFIGHSIDHRVSLTALDHHLSMTHQRQMLGNVRLTEAHRGGKLTNSHLTVTKQMQNLQPLRVGKDLADL